MSKVSVGERQLVGGGCAEAHRPPRAAVFLTMIRSLMPSATVYARVQRPRDVLNSAVSSLSQLHKSHF